MKTKIEIKSVWGSVLFSCEKEDNTIKDTLEEAVRSGANLVSANLRGANLGDTNLVGANLGGAYLVGANLGGAYLVGANLGGANLGGANLGDTNLGNANLVGANLGGAYLVGANLGGEWGELQSSSDVLIVGPIGSRNDYTTICHTDKGIFVRCGCFRGSLSEFRVKVKERHGESKHAKDYLALIDFVKAKYDERED